MSSGMKMVLLLLTAITVGSVVYTELAPVLLGTVVLGMVGLYFMLTEVVARVWQLQQKQLEVNAELIKRVDLQSQAMLLLKQEIGRHKQ